MRTVTDVSKTVECRRAVQQVMEAFGALDILINCAGVSMSTAAGHSDEARIKFFEADPEGWQRILAINTIGAFLMARFAAEPMIQRGWGRIIHVTTSFDTMLAAGLSAYGASKAALEASCVSFAKDLEGTGVTVNILVPGGPTETPGFFPPGKPRPPILLDPEIMAVPVVWLDPTASAPAASSHATGIGPCRRPRPRQGRARRLHGLHSRRPRVQPAGTRCSRHVCLVSNSGHCRNSANAMARI